MFKICKQTDGFSCVSGLNFESSEPESEPASAPDEDPDEGLDEVLDEDPDEDAEDDPDDDADDFPTADTTNCNVIDSIEFRCVHTFTCDIRNFENEIHTLTFLIISVKKSVLPRFCLKWTD